MLRAIIFDMDGVICDSEPLHMKAFQQVLLEAGISLTDQDYYDKYLAFDDRGCFQAVWKEHGRTLDAGALGKLLERKARCFDEAMKDNLVIYPGAEGFVKKAGEKYPLALASGARRLEVEFVLKKANIRHCFTAVVSADDVKEGKPHPESFQTALKILNEWRLDGTPPLESGECVVIEDSKHGIAAARSAGMKSVAITTSFKASELTAADLVIDSLVGFGLEQVEKLFG